MRALFPALSSWRPASGVIQRRHQIRQTSRREHPDAIIRQPPPVWLREHGRVRWLGCLRLPLCLTDATFVVDNIRREHSPPAFFIVSLAPDDAVACRRAS